MNHQQLLCQLNQTPKATSTICCHSLLPPISIKTSISLFNFINFSNAHISLFDYSIFNQTASSEFFCLLLIFRLIAYKWKSLKNKVAKMWVYTWQRVTRGTYCHERCELSQMSHCCLTKKRKRHEKSFVCPCRRTSIAGFCDKAFFIWRFCELFSY